ncbi:MAG: hypothetical protein AB8F74_23105 [Saprospiraceae bacterium]
MKNLKYFMVFTLMIVMTSCLDIMEELTMKKNGSGKYILTLDMSSMMEEGMRDMLKGMAQQEGEGDFMSEMPSEMDTMIYFNNADDTLKAKFQHPEILEKIAIRTQISESKELMKMTFALDFDKLKEVDYFLADLDKLQGDGGGLPGVGGGGGLFPTASEDNPLFKLKKRKLSRSIPEKSEDLNMEGEELSMMKMFFSDAAYTTVYNMPGKIKKTSMKNAEVDGKQIKIVTPLMDILEGKAEIGGDICFKRR